jgi:hypothetical protein
LLVDRLAAGCRLAQEGICVRFPSDVLYSAGIVFEGEVAVRGYFAASRMPSPDQANEIIAIGAEGDTVLVEIRLG